MNKTELLDQLQQCYEEQLELKEKELMILSALGELDPNYKILSTWLSTDLNQIYEGNNDCN